MAKWELKKELDQALRDLVAIATRRQPGQVTHKIADIEEIFEKAYQQGRNDYEDEITEQ